MAKSSPTSRYSRYVSLMKIILPLGIIFSIGFVIGWPYLISIGKENLTMIDPSRPEIQENRMMRPHYVSTDEDGQPFQLNAEWAKQKTETLADLISPQGSITMTEGKIFNIESKKGQYDSQGKILTLEENVTLTSSEGEIIKTERAHLLIDSNTIEGYHYIEGSGPTGEIMGEKGFKIETHPEGGKVLTLKGPSRVIINSASLKKNNRDTHAQ